MILITGASGFLGSFVVDEFLKQDFKVRASARPTSDLSYLQKTKAETVFLDITNPSQIKNALQDIEEVVHVAAILGGGNRKREDFLRINYEATKNLANTCIEQGIKRFTFVSSIAAVGPTKDPNIMLNENSEPHPIGPYGESKLLAEEYLLSLARDNKLEVVILRPALIYGPRDKRCAVNYFRIANLGFFPLPTPFSTKASFIYVSDVARAIFLAHTRSKSGEVYMLANDVITIRDFVKRMLLAKRGFSLLIPFPRFLLNGIASVYGFIFRLLGKETQLDKRLRDFGLTSWAIDSSKIRERLGFKAQVNLTEGLKKTWAFYGKHKNLLSLKYLVRRW